MALDGKTVIKEEITEKDAYEAAASTNSSRRNKGKRVLVIEISLMHCLQIVNKAFIQTYLYLFYPLPPTRKSTTFVIMIPVEVEISKRFFIYIFSCKRRYIHDLILFCHSSLENL